MSAPHRYKPGPRKASARAMSCVEGGVAEVALSDVHPPGRQRSRTGRALGGIADGLSDGLFAVDAAGLLTYVRGSAEHVFGAFGDEVVGQTVWDLLPMELAASFRWAFDRVLTTGAPATIEWFSSPLKTWFETRLYPAADGIAACLRADTGRRRMEIPVDQVLAREAAPHPEAEAWRPSSRDPRLEAAQALLGMAEALVASDDAALAAAPLEEGAVVRRFAEFARHLLGGQRLCLTALEPQTGRLQPMFGLGWAAETERQWKAEGSGYALRDILSAALIRRLQAGEVVVVGAATRGLPHDQPQEARRALLAPLRIGSRLIGMLGVDCGADPHHLSRQQREAASAVARLCATLFERERLRHERAAAYEDGLAAREEAQRMQLFMATVSHELRTPLAVVKAYQQLAERQLGALFPDAETAAPAEGVLQAAREFLTQAQQASGRLSTLLEDLMRVSSAKAGKLRVQRQLCDLVDMVSDTIRQLQGTNPARRIELRLPATRRVPVRADPERIVQVVTNYLTNAFKYSPADQPVEVRVQARGQIARVAVRDRGPGLCAADRKAIWDGYYQAPDVQLQPGADAGLGVGLYICRTIIEQHAGQVGVDSAAGRGATFWFKLPITANAM